MPVGAFSRSARTTSASPRGDLAAGAREGDPRRPADQAAAAVGTHEVAAAQGARTLGTGDVGLDALGVLSHGGHHVAAADLDAEFLRALLQETLGAGLPGQQRVVLHAVQQGEVDPDTEAGEVAVAPGGGTVTEALQETAAVQRLQRPGVRAEGLGVRGALGQPPEDHRPGPGDAEFGGEERLYA
ncbi:hypothetical protein OIE49_35985 [Streptomyces sp. NBC_01788]|nr:hypothetical protein [Streptomyces sp. NBC_01788]WSB30819.1 hypothetical protein OIE49_35985 [Streptomyces sp. NBC_01788]